MANSASYIQLAKTLPPRLTRFFTRFPPRVTPNTPEPPQSSPSLSIPKPVNSQDASASLLAGHPISDAHFNPFLPWKNPVTGKWRGAMYGLRKQADMCKLARKYGVEDLLPWSRKKLAVKRARKELLGVRVKGTGIGQTVKGHKSERGMSAKLDARRQAMRSMPDLVRQWKIASYGKRWKNWPK